MEALEEFTPLVEPLSLDEAMLDMQGCERRHPSWLDAAEAIRDRVREAAGISASIGIGGTRAVAHVATTLAKPGGVMEVVRGEEAAFLADLPLGHLPGVGPRLEEALARFHLRTIGDLAAVPEEVLEQSFGRVGVDVSRRARGLDSDHDALTGPDRAPRTHSISRETSFARDTCDPERIDGMISYLAQRAGNALRVERGLVRSVGVRLRYADFKTVEARRRLLEPTDRDDVILAVARSLWPLRYDRRLALRLVGVTLCDVVPAAGRQMGLFETGRAAALDGAVDRIRERHGFGALVRGRAIGLLAKVPADARGFRLRTPGCSR
jgi:DNA polymerase-4